MNNTYKTVQPEFRDETCPACSYQIAIPFLDSNTQPLATLAWPDNEEQALAMPQLPLNFLRCVDCGHVYNRSFRYDNVPYTAKPNLMFNQGREWGDFVWQLIERLSALLPGSPTVVEVGHGDGSFLDGLAKYLKNGRFIGFDPNGAGSGSEVCEFRNTLFIPEKHLIELRPTMMISRHVLEHLANPLGFLQRIANVAEHQGHRIKAYLEVPCIDKAISTERSVDFYYEHNSHFTSRSFKRMLSRSGAESIEIGQGYGGEVIYGLCDFDPSNKQFGIVQETLHYREAMRNGLQRISKQLYELYKSGCRVAIWGGTGKSAAFMNRYGVDRERFPIVVDSDPLKVGTFVPGTAQPIRFRDYLIKEPVEVVIIPPQWRARDIVQEMKSTGIKCQHVLIENKGELVDFYKSEYVD